MIQQHGTQQIFVCLTKEPGIQLGGGKYKESDTCVYCRAETDIQRRRGKAGV